MVACFQGEVAQDRGVQRLLHGRDPRWLAKVPRDIFHFRPPAKNIRTDLHGRLKNSKIRDGKGRKEKKKLQEVSTG